MNLKKIFFKTICILLTQNIISSNIYAMSPDDSAADTLLNDVRVAFSGNGDLYKIKLFSLYLKKLQSEMGNIKKISAGVICEYWQNILRLDESGELKAKSGFEFPFSEILRLAYIFKENELPFQDANTPCNYSRYTLDEQKIDILVNFFDAYIDHCRGIRNCPSYVALLFIWTALLNDGVFSKGLLFDKTTQKAFEQIEHSMLKNEEFSKNFFSVFFSESCIEPPYKSDMVDTSSMLDVGEAWGILTELLLDKEIKSKDDFYSTEAYKKIKFQLSSPNLNNCLFEIHDIFLQYPSIFSLFKSNESICHILMDKEVFDSYRKIQKKETLEKSDFDHFLTVYSSAEDLFLHSNPNSHKRLDKSGAFYDRIYEGYRRQLKTLTLNLHNTPTHQVLIRVHRFVEAGFKKNWIDSLNIIAGRGWHTTTVGDCRARALVLLWLCINGHNFAVLNSNNGVISVRIHRDAAQSEPLTYENILKKLEEYMALGLSNIAKTPQFQEVAKYGFELLQCSKQIKILEENLEKRKQLVLNEIFRSYFWFAALGKQPPGIENFKELDKCAKEAYEAYERDKKPNYHILNRCPSFFSLTEKISSVKNCPNYLSEILRQTKVKQLLQNYELKEDNLKKLEEISDSELPQYVPSTFRVYQEEYEKFEDYEQQEKEEKLEKQTEEEAKSEEKTEEEAKSEEKTEEEAKSEEKTEEMLNSLNKFLWDLKETLRLMKQNKKTSTVVKVLDWEQRFNKKSLPIFKNLLKLAYSLTNTLEEYDENSFNKVNEKQLCKLIEFFSDYVEFYKSIISNEKNHFVDDSHIKILDSCTSHIIHQLKEIFTYKNNVRASYQESGYKEDYHRAILNELTLKGEFNAKK